MYDSFEEQHDRKKSSMCFTVHLLRHTGAYHGIPLSLEQSNRPHDGRGWCWCAASRMPCAILRESVVASVASPHITTTHV